MKNYKDFTKKTIGESDVAALTLVGCGKEGLMTQLLRFHEDDVYDAYIVKGEAEIGEHYTLINEFHSWLKIYDDTSLSARFDAEIIRVYRAGMKGCIIQLLDE